MLHELDLGYSLRLMPFPPRVHVKTYRQENPLGTIPLYLEGQLRMTESAAICQYLADRHSPGALGVTPAEPAWGCYLNFLHFGEATLTFPQTLVLRYLYLEPPERRQPGVAEDYRVWFLARLRTLEPLLEVQDHLCAGRFTAADVSVGYALLLAKNLGLSSGFPPAVAAYAERLETRPAFRAAQTAEVEAAIAQGVDPRSPFENW